MRTKLTALAFSTVIFDVSRKVLLKNLMAEEAPSTSAKPIKPICLDLPSLKNVKTSEYHITLLVITSQPTHFVFRILTSVTSPRLAKCSFNLVSVTCFGRFFTQTRVVLTWWVMIENMTFIWDSHCVLLIVMRVRIFPKWKGRLGSL